MNGDQFVVPFSPQTIKNLEGMSNDTDLQRIFQCFILKILLNKIHWKQVWLEMYSCNQLCIRSMEVATLTDINWNYLLLFSDSFKKIKITKKIALPQHKSLQTWVQLKRQTGKLRPFQLPRAIPTSASMEIRKKNISTRITLASSVTVHNGFTPSNSSKQRREGLYYLKANEHHFGRWCALVQQRMGG